MIKKHFIAASAAFALSSLAPLSSPAHAGTEPFVGELMLVGYDFCPQGWLEARGQILPIAQHQALFALLGTRYGGDGRTTFALPNMRTGEGANKRWCIAMNGQFPSRP